MNRAFRRFWDWLMRKFGRRKSTVTQTPNPFLSAPRSQEWSARSPSLSAMPTRRISNTSSFPSTSNTRPTSIRTSNTTQEVQRTEDNTSALTSGLILAHVLNTPSTRTESPNPSPSYRTETPPEPPASFRTGGAVESSGFRTGGTESTRDWTPVEKPAPSYSESETKSSYSSSSSDSGSSYSSSSSSDSGSSSSSSSSSSSE